MKPEQTSKEPIGAAPLDATVRRIYRDASVIEVILCNGELFVTVDGYTVIDATAKTIKMTTHRNA